MPTIHEIFLDDPAAFVAAVVAADRKLRDERARRATGPVRDWTKATPAERRRAFPRPTPATNPVVAAFDR